MRRALLFGVLMGSMLFGGPAQAGEIGFEEDYALAGDRAKALEQLIPGTEEHYYYLCLLLQSQGKLADVDAKIDAWSHAHGNTQRVEEMRNRQALLKYAKEPRTSLDFLAWRLNLRFEHERRIAGERSALPTRIDPALYAWPALRERALSHYSDLGGFEQRAIEALAQDDLGPDRRRALLQRLERPDVPGLVKLVVEDLAYQYAPAFGAYRVHREMLQGQLDEALKLRPSLKNEGSFVQIYCTKLAPGPDEDWRHDAKLREAYLDRLWAFVSTLSPAHNSLKASVLYHRLQHDRAEGKIDRARFFEYLKLPRWTPYVHPDYIRSKPQLQNHAVDLNANFQAATQLAPIASDEPLVRDILLTLLAGDADTKAFEQYIEPIWLRRTFAEAKLVSGAPDPEKWYAMLGDAGAVVALRERVDIDFAPTTKTTWKAEEPVALDVDVKNVRQLIVKVFEIDTVSWFRDQQKEIDLAVDLDGLVASEERKLDLDDAPMRRVRRHIELPSLSRRGVFVVELIGNGRSSRALLRKGQLRFTERAGAAGHVFHVFDEARSVVKGASIWLSGREHRAAEDGSITIPFTTSPRLQNIVIQDGGFASLERFEHRGEQYALRIGVTVEREALLKRAKARVAIRPTLSIDGTPVSLALLEEPLLTIRSTDKDGTPSSKEVLGLTLTADKELVYELQVPDDLAELRFGLSGKVRTITTGARVDVRDEKQFPLNQIDATPIVTDLQISRTAAGYVLSLLGKNGEPDGGRPVNVVLKHRDFVEEIDFAVQTDAKGRIDLGPLEGIASVRASGPEGVTHSWTLQDRAVRTSAQVHGRAGEIVLVPYEGKATEPTRAALSLLEVRNGISTGDRFELLSLEEGYVVMRGLAPGSYVLVQKETGTRTQIEVTAGPVEAGMLLGERRMLEPRARAPLALASIETTDDALKVKVRGATPSTRVHVVATRFLPAYPLYDALAGRPTPPRSLVTEKDESFYVSGRDIGDEYRYILDRRYAKKYPGNMLDRPSLLLNPWALRDTDTEDQGVGGGGAYGGRAGGRRNLVARGGGAVAETPLRTEPGFANLDFLPAPSAALYNLVPDASGLVTVARKDLGDGQQVHVVVTGPDGGAYRQVALPEKALAPRDVRLRDGLDASKHVSEQRRATVVEGGTSFTLGDITTSKLEAYDTLRRVYGFYATRTGDATLAEFSFVADWPKLSTEQKREKYSKYACHELSFFLYKKDPEFFATAIKPYLENKKDKTFLDLWLLGKDVSTFLEPWAYARLNIVERILLAQRSPGEPAVTEKHVKDLFDLIPPNEEEAARLFHTAIAGSALESGDELGLRQAQEKASEAKEVMRRARFAAGEDMAGGASGATRDYESLAEQSESSAKPAEEPAPALAPPAPPASAAAGPMPEMAKKLAKREEAEADEFAGRAKDKADRDDDSGRMVDDLRRRAPARPFYRPIDKTREWAENNYWHLPIAAQNGELITANGFWADYAAHVTKGGASFTSPRFIEACRSFPEMMLALAVLDLPFEAKPKESSFEGTKMTLRPAGPTVVFHKEILESEPAKDAAPVLVGQNYFRLSDRYRYEGGERFDKYVQDEMLVRTAYGCQVVLTNPTGSRRKLEVLMQIPRGAVPLAQGFYTRGKDVRLEPFSTVTFEYVFYFPSAGTFAHYPVHVSQGGKYVASAAPAQLKVVESPTNIDRTTWEWISQNGSDEDVLRYLGDANFGRTELSQIAWRMKDKAFFERAIALIAKRHGYDDVLWSYAIKHDARAAAREYLRHQDGFLSQIGATIDTPLVLLDPVERRTYQHLEYAPLANARAHSLGKRRTIQNPALHEQYHALLRVLCYEPALDDGDRLAVSYYMLLQDRVEEAMSFFARVDAGKVATRLQYDYMQAYLDLFTPEHKLAREIAARYKDHPVDRWRRTFQDVAAKLDEAEGKGAKVVDQENRDQQQARLAATEAAFELAVESKRVTITHQNLRECTVNYYLMDVELLFSKNPFVQQRGGGQFAFVKPNRTEDVKLPEGRASFSFDLPKELASANVVVEVVAGGLRKSVVYFSNSLVLKVIEPYGQLRVTHDQTGAPLPGVYVKVYARTESGGVRFHKDGYTDIRGAFDYASLSAGGVEAAQRYSILVLSEKDGAIVREAEPPKQ